MNHEEKTATAGFFFSINSQITALWGIYVAATFAGAGFSLATKNGLTVTEAGFAAAGFLVFAIGHYHLIRNAVQRLNAVRTKVVDLAATSEGQPAFSTDFARGETTFDQILLIATHPTGPWSRSAMAHILIDLCVVALIFRAQIYQLF